MEDGFSIVGKKMKRILNFLAAGLSLMAIFAQVNNASAQSASATNVPVTGQLAGLAQLARNAGAEDELPARLCGVLWPNSGKHNYTVKKFSMPTKQEERLFCVRTNNQDIVLVNAVETKPNEDTKKRKEIYYRTTVKGDLVLAVSVNFDFTIDDVDNELLKKVTFTTYGDVSGDGSKPLAITADVRAKFEAEKKYWLGLEKKLGKKGRNKKAD